MPFKAKRKQLAIVSSAALFAGSLVATSVPSAAAASAPVSLTIMENAYTSMPPTNQDVILQALDKALGVNIQLNLFASGTDYQNQLNVHLAAGDFPDLFSVSHTTIPTLIKQGALLDLTPYEKELAPTLKFIGANAQAGMVNGHLYAISKAPNINYSTYWVRGDWLKKLGLSVPKTPAQLLKVANAFVKDDPDGNGKKDTYGITGIGMAAFTPIFGSYGIGLSSTDPDFYIRKGKVQNALLDPNMPKALRFIHQLEQAGAVDPSIVTNTSPAQVQQEAFSGEAGIMYLDWPNVMKDNFVQEYKKINPNESWVQIPALQGPGGKYVGDYDISNPSGMFALPSSLSKDPARLKKVIQLLNYVSTTEGNRLVEFGVKGRDYNLSGKSVAPTPLMAQEGGYFWVYQFTGRPEMSYLLTKFTAQKPYIKFAAKQPVINRLNGYITFPADYNPTDASTFISQELTNFVFGKRNLNQYSSFIKDLNRSFHFNDYVKAADQQLKTRGLVK